MSYASKLDRPLWMSDYTWKALWGDFAADAAGSTRSWVARNRTRGVNDPGPAAAAAAMLVSSSILLSSLGQDELNYAGIVPTSSVSPTVLERSQVGGTQTQAVAAAELATAASVVLVSGILNPSLGQAELNYAWVMPTSSVSPGILQKWQRLVAPAASAREGVHPAGRYYSLRLLDPNGAVLADRAFAPLKIAHGLGKKKAFFVTFPAPVGSVARIELLDGTVVLASRMPGLSAPAVSILQPTGRDTITGGPTVVFRAIDPDGDRLLYIVQYCPELSKGPRCYTLAKGLPVPVGSEVVTFARPSFAGFPGSTTARFRVIISDGFHTTMASSPAFSVPNRSPRPAIVVPATGQTVPAGRPVTLKGSATDVEDGGLPGAALKWMVDGRDLGSGKQQRIDGLAPGIHDVTLRVADRSGLQATATVSFTVDLLQVPVRTTPTLDGDCEDLAYATGAKLSLRPYADGDQATVYLVHTRDHLWACFAGLKRSTDGGVSGAYAGLRIDVDNSRDPAVATDDLGVFVGEDGAPFTAAGANLAAAGPDAMVARVGASEATWRAELRIAASKLRGWEHLVSLAVGHFSLGAADHAWPYLADAAKPNTWARTQFVRRRAPSPPESANR
jgi:hypothetical protein